MGTLSTLFKERSSESRKTFCRLAGKAETEVALILSKVKHAAAVDQQPPPFQPATKCQSGRSTTLNDRNARRPVSWLVISAVLCEIERRILHSRGSPERWRTKVRSLVGFVRAGVQERVGARHEIESLTRGQQ